jgi:predicted hotdog family 3-hydroxylacyl-ACP dehydratase
MSLDRNEIAKLIPHTGLMVLLDRVVTYDATSITCWTESHLRLDNPLRRDNTLPAMAGIELAAQAMAVHGRLTRGETRTRKGLLGSLRDVSVNCQRLDDVRGALAIDVKMLSGSTKGGIYSFRISSEDGELLLGRAAVFFQ